MPISAGSSAVACSRVTATPCGNQWYLLTSLQALFLYATPPSAMCSCLRQVIQIGDNGLPWCPVGCSLPWLPGHKRSSQNWMKRQIKCQIKRNYFVGGGGYKLALISLYFWHHSLQKTLANINGIVKKTSVWDHHQVGLWDQVWKFNSGYIVSGLNKLIFSSRKP